MPPRGHQRTVEGSCSGKWRSSPSPLLQENLVAQVLVACFRTSRKETV
jgi:hypothetical protein